MIFETLDRTACRRVPHAPARGAAIYLYTRDRSSGREPVEDAAQVNRMCDVIMVRTFQRHHRALPSNSRVPVINASPTSTTPGDPRGRLYLLEHRGPIKGRTWPGSAIEQCLQHVDRGAEIFGFRLHISTPGLRVEAERRIRNCDIS